MYVITLSVVHFGLDSSSFAAWSTVYEGDDVVETVQKLWSKLLAQTLLDDACEGILGGKVNSGDCVVITHEGPKGGPGWH